MELRKRDIEIIELLCKDKKQKYIADKVAISLSGLEKDVCRIKSNFGVTTLHGLVYEYMIYKLG